MDQVQFGLRREAPFSYICNRCNRCCYGKRIPLTPYDLIRLSEARKIGTGQLIREFTEDGVFLRVRDDEAGEPCIFLGPQGCSVHSGRPAACRIYPLGRVFTSEGVEGFCLVEPHPRTEGEYGEAGTVGDYVDGQGLDPYFRAAHEYNMIFEAIVARFSEIAPAALKEEGPAPELEADDLLDVDHWVAEYCARHELALPADSESKRETHLAALREWLAELGNAAG